MGACLIMLHINLYIQIFKLNIYYAYLYCSPLHIPNVTKVNLVIFFLISSGQYIKLTVITVFSLNKYSSADNM